MKQESVYRLLYGRNELHTATHYLYGLKEQCDIYAFKGSLGSGKTTLVQALLRCYGVTASVTSPTFTYMQQYQGKSGVNLYHFDLYRLSSLSDFIQAGFDEYLYKQGSWSFIEWPEIIEPLLVKRVCYVLLDYYNLEQRQMTCYVQ